MLLRKLYSYPLGLFKNTVEDDGVIYFKNGINYIYGKKDNQSDTVESLNGIGKSLLLDLIDFCLLCTFDKRKNPRLFEAKKYLDDYKIVLEFTVDNIYYEIRRNTIKPDLIEFGESGALKEYEKNILIELLGDLIFRNPDYPGFFDNRMYRSLMLFFLKIHKSKQAKFVDPIEYIKEVPVTVLNQYHLYLLGIDNSLINKNLTLVTKLKGKAPALREIKRFLESSYNLKIKEIGSEIDNLRRDVENLDKFIKSFKLGEQYKDVELRANALTAEIKERVFLNIEANRQVTIYESSYRLDNSISIRDTKRVERIFAEFQELVGEKIGKVLEDAVRFRIALSKSRQEFLNEEIQDLEEDIKINEEVIRVKEEQRAGLFEFLDTKEAIKDLSEAFSDLNDKKKKLNELEGKYRLYKDMIKEKEELRAKEGQLKLEALIYVEKIKQYESDFRQVFVRVYNSIYPKSTNKSLFSITDDLGKQQKISININIPADRSEGKNQGRTLIYDLSVLLNAIDTNIRCPRFLVHDGIFDGVDKAHFVSVCNYLNKLASEGVMFQYIIPINEEGTLNENFGDIDGVTPEKIEEQAIIVLTPTKKLLGKSWA